MNLDLSVELTELLDWICEKSTFPHGLHGALYPVLLPLTLFALMSGFLTWPVCGLRLRSAAIRVNSGHPMFPPLDKLFVAPDLEHEVS